MNSLLRADHEKWTSKVAELNEENRTQQSRYNAVSYLAEKCYENVIMLKC